MDYYDRNSFSTEEEATKRFCPLLGFDAATGFLHTCWASRCMAWRWAEVHRGRSQEVWLGYCGMAGTPVSPAKVGAAA
jgi:hypothetical protein